MDLEANEWLQLLIAFISLGSVIAAWRAASASKSSAHVAEIQSQRDIEPKLYLNADKFRFSSFFNNEWGTIEGICDQNIGKIQERMFSPYFLEIYNLGNGFAKDIGVHFDTPAADMLFDSKKKNFNYSKSEWVEVNEQLLCHKVTSNYTTGEHTYVYVDVDGTQLFNFLTPFEISQNTIKIKLPYKFVLPIEMAIYWPIAKNSVDERVLKEMMIDDIFEYSARIFINYKNVKGEVRYKEFKIKLKSLSRKYEIIGDFDIQEIK